MPKALKSPRPSALVLCALVAVGLIGALPSTASAKAEIPTGESSSPQGLPEFHLRGSNGFQISVSDTGERQVSLTAEKGPASAHYQVRGKRTEAGGIDAKFPGVGRVSVKFKPIGKPRRVPPLDNCKGPGNQIQRGVFIGTIAFTGERGFTRVRAQRAKGEVVAPSPKESCKHGKAGNVGEILGGAFGEFHIATLYASSVGDGGIAVFTAAKFTSKAHPRIDDVGFTALTFLERGHMSIFKVVTEKGGDSSFLQAGPDQAPESLTLSPPEPFQGTASFQRATGSSPSWTGSLGVEFPGGPQVALTGPQFKAEFCPAAHNCFKAGPAS